jgi:hypothetical protein
MKKHAPLFLFRETNETTTYSTFNEHQVHNMRPEFCVAFPKETLPLTITQEQDSTVMEFVR